MNTVLDDNMTLCLSNGERIKLRPEMRMMFEVDDLSQASPATVSRCGMVYASPQALNWRPIVTTWIKRLDDTMIHQKLKDLLQNLFDTHIDNTIELIRGKGFKEPIPTVDNNFIISMCRLFKSILEHVVNINQYEGDRQKKAIIKIFIYSLAWSFGGSIDSRHHS
jgi:dynein heavy chain